MQDGTFHVASAASAAAVDTVVGVVGVDGVAVVGVAAAIVALSSHTRRIPMCYWMERNRAVGLELPAPLIAENRKGLPLRIAKNLSLSLSLLVQCLLRLLSLTSTPLKYVSPINAPLSSALYFSCFTPQKQTICRWCSKERTALQAGTAVFFGTSPHGIAGSKCRRLHTINVTHHTSCQSP